MDGTEERPQPADEMRERGDENRLKGWFLLDANRWAVTGVLSAGAFVLLVLLGLFGPSSIEKLLTTSAVATVFSSMIIAIITGVTLVLTIGQVVLSQELGPLGDQRDRMSGAMSFREDVENSINVAVSPVEPSLFLRALVEASQKRANRFRDTVADSADQQVRNRVDDYVNSLADNADQVGNQLEGAQFGSFDVLRAALNYNYGRKIHTVRQIRSESADSLSQEATDALDELLTVLEFFGPAREHFKTLYFRWELINVSRAILYAATPALVLAAYMVLLFQPNSVSGATLGVSHLLLVVGATFTISVLPFVLLLAYLLRILTVAKRTLAIGPFILRETDSSDSIDRNE